MGIRLYFNLFNANQLYSPILGEYRGAKKRLQNFASDLLPQLKRRPKVPSKSLPVKIHIHFFTSKDNFDTASMCILVHKIVDLLGTEIIQDTNNLCINGISFDFEYVKRLNDEGCEITAIKG